MFFAHFSSFLTLLESHFIAIRFRTADLAKIHIIMKTFTAGKEVAAGSLYAPIRQKLKMQAE